VVKGLDRLRAVGIIREDVNVDYSSILQTVALASRDEYLKRLFYGSLWKDSGATSGRRWELA